MAAAHCQQHGGGGQRGGGVGSAAAVATGRLQHGSGSGSGSSGSSSSGSTLAAAGLAATMVVWRHLGVSGCSRVARAALLPCAAMVVTKTPAATAMAGAKTTVNNQLKVAAATAMETALTMTIKM